MIMRSKTSWNFDAFGMGFPDSVHPRCALFFHRLDIFRNMKYTTFSSWIILIISIQGRKVFSMVWSQDNWTIGTSGMGIPDDRPSDCQCAGGFTLTAPSHSSIDLLSAAPHYSLMRSAAPTPPPTHTYIQKYVHNLSARLHKIIAIGTLATPGHRYEEICAPCAVDNQTVPSGQTHCSTTAFRYSNVAGTM